MNYIVKQKRGNSIYVYEVTNYWDKEKRQPRQKRKYLGRIDPVSGEFIKSTGIKGRKAMSTMPKASRDYGNVYLLDRISERIGLKEILKKIYPYEWKKILSLAYFAVSESSPFYLFEQWKVHTYIKGLKGISSQLISKLLKELGKLDRLQLDFSINWCANKGDTDALIFDITSVSSYSELIELVEWGYSRDKEYLPQINIGMVFGEPSSLPLFYSVYPGSIPDIVTLKNIVLRLKKFNINTHLFILDRGFYSRNNVELLKEERLHYLMPLPFTTNLSKEILTEYKTSISSPENFFSYNGKIVFGIEKEVKVKQSEDTIHLFMYLDEERKAIETQRFLKNIVEIEDAFNEAIDDWRERMEKKALNRKKRKKNKEKKGEELNEEAEDAINPPFIDENEVKEFINGIAKGYARYFNVNFKDKNGKDKEHIPVVIERNNKEIEKALTRMGRMILITDDDKLNKEKALSLYRRRNNVERVFNVLKNRIDGDRLRTHSTDAASGKLFILFIALILYSALDKLMREKKVYDKYTMNELMEMLKNIRTVELQSGPVYLTEVPKKAKDIFRLFNIDIPAPS
jgi:transposase